MEYHTGLGPNLEILIPFIQFLTTDISEHWNSELLVFQQILIVLMKLRLNVDEQDLTYQIFVSQPTVSPLFNKRILVMAQ